MPDRPVHVHIQELSQVLVDLSTRVVGNLFEALCAVKYQDEHGVPRIKLVENELDMEEIDLEEQCIQFIALQHPVAKDLRTIIAIMMISHELERIGEISLHIIDSMFEISPALLELLDFESMFMLAGEMVKKSIDAFVLQDRDLADQVCAHDDEVDAMHRAAFKKVTALMKIADADVIRLTNALSISRNIERMADHASKIAQEVIYLVTGELVKHKDSRDD
ncbi:MAG: phosphate signaling complex protein PhoU [Chlorobiaceae bacterium]|nr:phosphate signaling complex protein PhoU [Chlorobiaceae bacterium]